MTKSTTDTWCALPVTAGVVPAYHPMLSHAVVRVVD